MCVRRWYTTSWLIGKARPAERREAAGVREEVTHGRARRSPRARAFEAAARAQIIVRGTIDVQSSAVGKRHDRGGRDGLGNGGEIVGSVRRGGTVSYTHLTL